MNEGEKGRWNIDIFVNEANLEKQFLVIFNFP